MGNAYAPVYSLQVRPRASDKIVLINRGQIMLNFAKKIAIGVKPY